MRQPSRLLLLLAATLAWLWASSPYTPWAEDAAPRLWLYDTLYYARVGLLAWLAAETALAAMRPARRGAPALGMLAAVALAWLAGWLYVDSGPGWRWRTRASLAALAAVADAGDSDRRQRAGHVLVDTVRTPCGSAAPWLWLGRPHGGGSGINLALVRSRGVPSSPVREAFVFLPLGAQWWMAYEDPVRHHAASAVRCVPGRSVANHRAGLAHVAAGR